MEARASQAREVLGAGGPLLQSGKVEVETDLPAVREMMAKIGGLASNLEALRNPPDGEQTQSLPRDEDEARWAGEGGANVGV
jgi:hypothetical protein